MHLLLGELSFDVTTRALTLLSFRPDELGKMSQLDGANEPHVLELDTTGAESESAQWVVDRLARIQSFNGPIAVRTSRADVAAACLGSGAHIAHNPDGLGDPAYLRTIEEAAASLVLSCPTQTADPVAFLTERVGWAVAAGVVSERIVVVGRDRDIVELARVATVMYDGGRSSTAQGRHAVAVRSGARLVARTRDDNDVRATRRTIDTVSELLERREPAKVNR